jgi:two-component system nitrate/nitrite response regulator NarL
MDWSCAVLVIDRSPLFREGLTRIIANGKFHIVATLSSVEDLAAAALPQDRPLLLVLGSRGDPAATAREINAFKQQCPDARIAVLAENHDAEDVVMSFRAGANAYLAKLACHDALIKSLELVMEGETLLSSAILAMILDQRQERGEPGDRADRATAKPEALEGDSIPHLSARERGILSCLAAGSANKVIAHRMGVTEATVKAYVKSILRKIPAINRTQAAIWATRHGYALETEEHSALQQDTMLRH